MKGKSSAINSLPEIVNIGQGSVSSTAVMSQQNVPANVTPVENRLSNYMISSDETCTHSASHGAQSFDGCYSDESSYRINLQNDIDNELLKREHFWSPLNASSGNSPEERQLGASNSFFRGRTDFGSSKYEIRDRPLFSQGSTSNVTYHNESPDAEYVGNSNIGRLEVGSGCSNSYKSSQSEIGQTSSVSFCRNSFGDTHNMIVENDGGPSSSGSWGLSCKRKALEGTSRQFCSGGSSGSFPQPEQDILRTGTAFSVPSSSLRLSPPAQVSHCTGLPELQNSSISASGMKTVSDVYTSSSVTNNFERSLSDLGRMAALRTSQDYVPFSILSAGIARHQSPPSFRDSVERSSAISAVSSGGTQGLSHGNEVPGISRCSHPFTWDGGCTSRVESLSSLSGHGSLHEDLNLGCYSRNNTEYHVVLPATETRNSTHDSTSWSLGPGNVSNSFCSPSTSQTSPSSSICSLPNPALISPNPPRENPGRLLEFTPWSLFPSTDAESGVPSGHFYPSPVAPASARDATLSSAPNSHRYHQSYPRSAYFLERLGDDISGTTHSLRTLAAHTEGRRQLISEIRQVLTVMQRAENLAAEASEAPLLWISVIGTAWPCILNIFTPGDKIRYLPHVYDKKMDHMLFDPFIYHGMAEIHDRHRDMRLDVDNMSYEELLALEDRIGDVSTGLSEDVILKILKQQKYELLKTPTPPDLEPCCICKEEYADADIVGTLDCGHNFHSNCIKQWLVLKNLCPICKTTALPK